MHVFLILLTELVPKKTPCLCYVCTCSLFNAVSCTFTLVLFTLLGVHAEKSQNQAEETIGQFKGKPIWQSGSQRWRPVTIPTNAQTLAHNRKVLVWRFISCGVNTVNMLQVERNVNVFKVCHLQHLNVCSVEKPCEITALQCSQDFSCPPPVFALESCWYRFFIFWFLVSFYFQWTCLKVVHHCKIRRTSL